MPKPLFTKASLVTVSEKHPGLQVSIAPASGPSGRGFPALATLPASRARGLASRLSAALCGAAVCVIAAHAGTAAAQTAAPEKTPQTKATPDKPAQAQGGLPPDAPSGAGEPDPLALTLKRARELRSAKKWDDALAVADKGLERSPRDLQLRFLKGLILTDQNKPDAAIPVFEALTQDYPELGEPYNNLAVLLAGKGELDRARGLLERAIQAQPNYALAYENLGDVHLRLAERSYQEAVSKNPALRSAKGKLDQAREWVKGTESKP